MTGVFAESVSKKKNAFDTESAEQKWSMTRVACVSYSTPHSPAMFRIVSDTTGAPGDISK